MIQLVTDLQVYPIFKNAVLRKTKTATIKLGNKTDTYKTGMELNLIATWDNREPMKLGRIRITEVKNVRIKRLTKTELSAEAPILRNINVLTLVLSIIYKTEVTDNNWVTFIKWKML